MSGLADYYRDLSEDVMHRWWAGIEGYAAFAFGKGGYLDESGKYTHLPSGWVERKHRLPDAIEVAALQASVATQDHSDIYVCPAVRVGTQRKKAGECVSRYAWADVDGWDAERQSKWDALCDRCVADGGYPLSYGSGGTRDGGGRHVYLDLGKVVSRDELESWNRRLAAHLNADSKWAANSLLRLPGTLNWKAPASDPSAQPRWVR